MGLTGAHGKDTIQVPAGHSTWLTPAVSSFNGRIHIALFFNCCDLAGALHGQIPGLQERLQRGRNQKEQNHQTEKIHRAAPDWLRPTFRKNAVGLLIQIKIASTSS
jgi:hypothetical protein